MKLRLAPLSLLAALAAFGCDGGGRTVIVCGGGAKFICPPGLYCDLGDNCGGIDKAGQCRPLAQNCPLESDPVCSCEGRNFQSACYAAAAGESVAYRGTCMKK